MPLQKGDAKLIAGLLAGVVAVVLIAWALVSAFLHKASCEDKGGFETRAGCVHNGEIISP